MKLTHLALMMTIALLGVTGWIAWDEHNKSNGTRNELEMYQRREASGGQMQNTVAAQNAMLQKEQQILALQSLNGKGGGSAGDADALPLSAAPPLTPIKQHILPPPANTPPPVSPMQHRIMALPSLAKVVEYQAEYGFVIINAGSTKNVSGGKFFLLRRGSAVVARIKIGDVDNNTSVGGIEKGSVPPGVTIEVGDEVIQDLPSES